VASPDAAVLTYIVKKPDALGEFQRAGITADHFVGDLNPKIWTYLCRQKRDHQEIPSMGVILHRFPDFEPDKTVKPRDLPALIRTLQDRKDYIDLLTVLDEASREVHTPEDVNNAISFLQGRLNEISVRNGKSSVVDMFSKEVQKRMLEDIKRRKSGTELGIPTGLKKFDAITGGLHRRRMVTLIGRPGKGKSWLNLMFVAQAVLNGRTVVLYPLEMTLEETALRLYTLFSSQMFGADKAIRNLDLVMGRVTKKRIVRLLNILEDRFSGQLYVADVGNLSDPYTIERMEAEIELYHPDLFWVDYLTLMKASRGRDGREDYTAVASLSTGIKNIAMRHNTVGGCSAQVNRDAMKTKTLLPRLEHIAYGDSIGQDADQVLSINRVGEFLFYSLVKNRHGPEIQRMRVKFNVDHGHMEEVGDEEGDDDD